MTEVSIIEAFNDCLEAVAAGASVDEAVRRYPQFAAELRPMLEAGALVRRQLPPSGEVNYARERARARVEAAAAARRRRAAPLPFYRLAQMAAALALVALAGLGMSVVAQPAIPGDPLYGFKRLTETLTLAVSGNPALSQAFAARRVSEIEELLARQQSADVVFTGILQAASGSDWLVEGLPLFVPAAVPGTSEARPGDRIEVSGFTSTDGVLTATAIRVLEPGAEPPLLPTVTPEATPTTTPTQTPSVTVSPTPTLTPTAQPTLTPTLSPSPSPTRAASQTPLPVTAAACVPARPEGWSSYRVRAGDTLSGLAASVGTAVSELMRANCIEDAGRIVLNQELFLPRLPSGPTATNPGQGTSGSGQAATAGPPDQSDDDDDDDDSSGRGSSSSGQGSNDGDDDDDDNDDSSQSTDD
jgi:LysM repeat protein